MKKLVCLLPLFLIAAIVYQPKTVSQNWKLNDASVLSQMDPISGRWEVVTPDKLKEPLLSQLIKYADFPKILFRNHDYYDFDASVNIYVSSEFADVQSGGLVLRYRNLYSFYMLFLNAKDKRITLTKASLYGLKVLKRFNYDFQPDHWYELKATCYLNHIKATVDNNVMFEVEDNTATGGKVGLVTAGPSKVYFRNYQINAQAIDLQQQ
jgi:3-keto-disaccharide hydrolase